MLFNTFATTAALSAALASPVVPANGPAPEVLFDNQFNRSLATRLAEPPTQVTCPDCSPNENAMLGALQERGITDLNALATILANVKQESTFVPNICEGGARVKYHQCHYGGYGLIQFTSKDRYDGLGNYAKTTGGDPSTFETQVGYIFTERQWLDIENGLKSPGKPIESYMNLAYRWLGWGVMGPRTKFAYDYAKRLQVSN